MRKRSSVPTLFVSPGWVLLAGALTAAALQAISEGTLTGSPQAKSQAHSFARPELIREVLEGKRQEARVSWWGFDARDSTEFLQNAINSKVKRLIVDRQAFAWTARPLRGVSNQEIIFEEGAELVALPGAFRAKGDCLLSFEECGNVIIRGEKIDRGKPAVLRMHKEEYQSSSYEKSEWRHGLRFLACQNVLVQDLRIEKTGGDGIYLGTSKNKIPNRNVLIRRVDCNANHRQGISVISAEDLLIEDCLLRNTSGTAPQAGIDFEPNSPADFLVNCVMRNCVAENNAGSAYLICPQFLKSSSKPISIRLESCVSRGNKQHAIHLCSAQKDPPGGLLQVTKFREENDGMAGLSVQFNPFNAMRIELEDSVIRDCAQRDSFFPPLYLQGMDSDTRPAGNLHFKNVSIKDDLERPVFKIRDRKGNGVEDITGGIVLERKGQKQTITIDEAWLEQIRRGTGPPVKSILLRMPSQRRAVVEKIAHLFVRQVESRCEAKVALVGAAALTVEFAIEPGIGAEGYRIADSAPNTIRIIGNDTRGLLYGVGKFLHTSGYGNGEFAPGSWRGISVPKMPVRGMYLATHFQNYYQVAPIEEVTRYVEELSLWGVNNYLVWFGMEEFNGISDPKAQTMLARLRALLGIVKDLGLDASLGCICNDGYKNSPAHLRADDRTVGHAGYHTRMGPRIYNLGNELCPSKPGVPEMQLGFCQEKFEAFKSVGLDYWFITPYDNGGCTCSNCSPWGINGYLRMAEPLARTYRRAFPQGKLVLGTWYFDRWADGEWAGLAATFNAKKPDWIDYIMADNFEEYPRYPLENGVPGGFPLLNFPDISMWGQEPWGGYGANPYPARLQARWDLTKHKLSGGMPYSEGIFEDLNKVICACFYWEPERPALEAVKDYIAYEFSPAVVTEVTSVVETFEKNHRRDQIGPSAVQTCELLERVESKLTPQARNAWRWRLFRIRAALDQELYRNRFGEGRQEVFRQAHAELLKISHAANSWPMLRPALIPAVSNKK